MSQALETLEADSRSTRSQSARSCSPLSETLAELASTLLSFTTSLLATSAELSLRESGSGSTVSPPSQPTQLRLCAPPRKVSRMNKPTWLMVAMALGIASTTTMAALAAGPIIAALTFVGAFGSTLAGLYHEKPVKPKPDEP